MFEPRALRFLCDTVGTDRIMLGSDYPFGIGDPAPVNLVDTTPLTQDERRAILRSLHLLPIGDAGVAFVLDALRTNDERLVRGRKNCPGPFNFFLAAHCTSDSHDSFLMDAGGDFVSRGG